MCKVWKGVWPQLARGGTVCKVTEYVKMLSAEASVLNLAAVSFERYFQRNTDPSAQNRVRKPVGLQLL